MNMDASLGSEHYPLIDAIDHEILMHRDAHFGGLFSVMLDYYREEKKGIQPEFDISRLEKLDEFEKKLKQNLAALFLMSSEMQKVADSRHVYQKLSGIYEVKHPKTKHPQLIADLILAEEEFPEKEIEAIVAEKGTIVPSLIEILRNEQLYDPLFPGYGLAPFVAVECLGRIGDKRAIIYLFEAIGQSDFFADEQIIAALKRIGSPARDFLLHVVNGRPLNEDNEKAAIALVAFKEEPSVADFCFNLFQQSDVQKDPCLPVYLALICAGLKNTEHREIFKKMSQDSNFPAPLRKDMGTIIQDWISAK